MRGAHIDLFFLHVQGAWFMRGTHLSDMLYKPANFERFEGFWVLGFGQHLKRQKDGIIRGSRPND
jgi:hypothetical protein